MKLLKYILLAIILISLSISSFSQGQDNDLKFLEAYTFGEFTAALDPHDPFFQMLDTKDRSAESSKLGFCPESKVSKTWDYLNSPSFLKNLPKDVKFAWGAEEAKDGKYLYALKKAFSVYTGPGQADIAEIEISDGMLLLTFSEEGAGKWTELTQASLGKPIAIVIHDLVYSAPMVREVIRGGNCAISGNFSQDELAGLKAVLEN
jgi:SecD/SecF fusion protein